MIDNRLRVIQRIGRFLRLREAPDSHARVNSYGKRSTHGWFGYHYRQFLSLGMQARLREFFARDQQLLEAWRRAHATELTGQDIV